MFRRSDRVVRLSICRAVLRLLEREITPSVRRHQALVRLSEKVKQRRSTENIPHAVVLLGLDLDTISICLQCGERAPGVQCFRQPLGITAAAIGALSDGRKPKPFA
jgi:hypothetical protein